MREETPAKIVEKSKLYHQEHVFRFWDELSEGRKEKLINQLKSVDFELLKQLADQHIVNPQRQQFDGKLEPVDIIPIPKTDKQKADAETAKRMGEQLLAQGKVAALLVAGGQGSRLGFDGPKGKFKAGPLSGKSLYQLHAEKIRAIGARYHKNIPWYIMTSETNDRETRDFFEENNYFGLKRDDVNFFTQRMIPALDENGKIIFDGKDHIFKNPNGHGGTLFSLYDSGMLADMKKRDIEQVFYFQVDNVLIKICDPYFIGYHLLQNAEMSAKVVTKRDPYEKVGVVGRLNGDLTVIEYSDLPEEAMKARNENGELKYGGGSIAVHIFRTDFIERLASGDLSLPYHVAHKKIPYLDQNGKLITPTAPNGYKFEMFIFDALPYARNAAIMEVDRTEDFSPIKNAEGEDSPATARQDLMNFHARLLRTAGVNIPVDEHGNVQGEVEISPLYALDELDLAQKLQRHIEFSGKLKLD